MRDGSTSGLAMTSVRHQTRRAPAERSTAGPEALQCESLSMVPTGSQARTSASVVTAIIQRVRFVLRSGRRRGAESAVSGSEGQNYVVGGGTRAAPQDVRRASGGSPVRWTAGATGRPWSSPRARRRTTVCQEADAWSPPGRPRRWRSASCHIRSTKDGPTVASTPLIRARTTSASTSVLRMGVPDSPTVPSTACSSHGGARSHPSASVVRSPCAAERYRKSAAWGRGITCRTSQVESRWSSRPRSTLQGSTKY